MKFTFQFECCGDGRIGETLALVAMAWFRGKKKKKKGGGGKERKQNEKGRIGNNPMLMLSHRCNLIHKKIYHILVSLFKNITN